MLNRSPLFALPFFVVGCLSNDNSPPATIDAGVPQVDAGGFDSTVPDAAIPDSALVETSFGDVAVDAGPQPVTVNVRKRGVPESGVTIVFGDAAGAILATATTDATGSASHVVAAGSQVTAIFGTMESPQFVTIQGVKPGDALVANDESVDPALASTVSIDALPADPPAGTANLSASAGECSAFFTAAPAQITIAPECQRGGKFPLLVVAEDVNALPLGYTFTKDISLLPDGGVPDSGVLPLTLGGVWSTSTTTQTLTAAHAPVPDAGSSFVGLTLSEVAGGIALATSQYFDGATLDGGVQSDDFKIHTGYPDFVQGEGTIRTSMGTGVAYQSIANRHAPPATTATDVIDLAQLLPVITTGTVDATVPARPVASWTVAAPLTAADGVVVFFRFGVPQFNSNGTWTIVAPPDATSVKAPELPASLSAWLPAVDTLTAVPTIAVVDATFITGYDQLRATGASFTPSRRLIDDSNGQIIPALPIDGTLRLSGFTLNGD